MAESEVTSHAGTKRGEVLAEMIEKYPQSSGEYRVACYAMQRHLKETGLHEQLKQLVESAPIWDGDLIDKGARKQLMKWGLCVSHIVDGDGGGHQSATIRGCNVYRAEKWL